MNGFIKLFLLNSFFLCFVACKRNDQTVSSDEVKYTISDNISNQHVTSICEDSKGYIWLATARGLNKYNGYEFYQYFKNSNVTGSISSNRVNSNLKDSQNRLWIASDGGISLLKDDTDFVSIPVLDSNYSPVQIIESMDGDIILNNRAHLCKYNSKENTFEKFYTFKEYNISNKIHIDESNNLWIIDINSIECVEYRTLKPILRHSITKKINVFYSYLIDGFLFIQHGTGGIKIFNTKTTKEVYFSSLKTHPTLSQALITNIHPYSTPLNY